MPRPALPNVDLRGQRVLVTGASAGLGVTFAHQLASLGADLVLTARREERLTALAQEIAADHGRMPTVIPGDLALPETRRELFERTEGVGLAVDVLINNAGFGTMAGFADMPWELVNQQLQLNVVALTELAWRFGRAMRQRRAGYILNVGSIASFTPAPSYATYAAGKAYVLSLSEALTSELAPSGVHVCCLCPGPTLTEFADVAGQPVADWQRPFIMSAERCTRIGLRALFGGRRTVVSGALMTGLTFGLRFVPRELSAWFSARTFTSRDP